MAKVSGIAWTNCSQYCVATPEVEQAEFDPEADGAMEVMSNILLHFFT